MLVDALRLVGMRVHQPVGRLVQIAHFVVERRQIALQSLVLALQTLHGGKVVADVIDLECLVLLFDPVARLVGVSASSTPRQP